MHIIIRDHAFERNPPEPGVRMILPQQLGNEEMGREDQIRLHAGKVVKEGPRVLALHALQPGDGASFGGSRVPEGIKLSPERRRAVYGKAVAAREYRRWKPDETKFITSICTAWTSGSAAPESGLDGFRRPHMSRPRGHGRQENFHTPTASVSSDGTETGGSPCIRSIQCRISRRPSGCSTSAVQLSTQSPSLQ